MKTAAARLRLLAFLAMLSASMAVPACANMTSSLQTAKTVVDAIDMVVDAIEGVGQSWFAQHPDPAKQAELALDVARVRAAAAAAENLVAAVGDLRDAKVVDAFNALENAYAQLLALGQSFGVRAAPPGTTAKQSAEPGVLVVPAPADLRCMVPRS